MRKRTRASVIFTAVCCLVVSVLGLASTPAAAPPPSAKGQGQARGLLGLEGMDHVGITVPNIGQAVAWFQKSWGARRR